MIKRFLNIALCAAMLGLTSCSASELPKGNDGRLSVVCTTFSCYDWTREIVGGSDDVRLTYLLDSGSDMHSFQPSAADLVTISGCDVFICVGGESEVWAEDAIKEAENKDMKVIRLLDALGSDAKEEELKEGMVGEDKDDGDEVEYDEHVWLSLKNAELLCGEIAEVLGEADPDNAADYKANCGAYTDKLSDLDGRFAASAEKVTQKTLIFGDRFPFRYLFDDYGLDYYAAFSGCAAETEASFETVAFLAQKADEIGADTIFIIDNSDGRIARAIIDNTESKALITAELDSIQSVSKEDIKSGKTYLSMMEENFEILEEAIK